MNTPSRTVLVTGCSSGIGRATARLLAEEGYCVFASVRSDADAAALADAALPTLNPILLDVTSADSVARAIAHVKERSPNGLAALVNNAGVGLPSAVELTTPEEFQKLLDVNTIAPLRVIRSCLPLLRAAEGRVINISSLNGTLASPMAGAYSASKFALVALSNALRVELRPWKVRVSLVAPGQVRTPVFEKARDAITERQEAMPAELRDGYETMYRRALKMIERGAKSPTSPEDVAAVVLKALTDEHPWPRYRVGFDSRAMRWVQALTPQWLLDRFLARAVGTFYSLK